MKQLSLRLSIAAVLLVLMGAQACTEFPPEKKEEPKGGEPIIVERGVPRSAAIIEVKAVGSVGNNGDFELSFFASDSNGKVITNLDPSTITIPGGFDTIFTPTGLATITSSVFGPYSAELLVDQSNSMKVNDANDFRLKGARLFLHAMSLLNRPGDEAQFSTFYDIQQGGLITYGPFTHNGFAFDPSIDALIGTHGPGTPLYDAMYFMCDSLNNSAQNSNKVLIVLTDGEDNLSMHSMWESIDHAKALGIKVFAIALKTGSRFDPSVDPNSKSALFNIAMNTGGSVMHTDDPEQLTPYYSALGTVLHGGTPYYKSKWHVSAPNLAKLSGRTIEGEVKIASKGGSDIIAPFSVTFP